MIKPLAQATVLKPNRVNLLFIGIYTNHMAVIPAGRAKRGLARIQGTGMSKPEQK
jgi:hypothetical protein